MSHRPVVLTPRPALADRKAGRTAAISVHKPEYGQPAWSRRIAAAQKMFAFVRETVALRTTCACLERALRREDDVKLLFINPNTSAHLTDMGRPHRAGVARPETEIAPATGRFGARYITPPRAAAAIAAHAALDCYAREGREADAVLIACFGDPGCSHYASLRLCP